jgi:hypothetical protein
MAQRTVREHQREAGDGIVIDPPRLEVEIDAARIAQHEEPAVAVMRPGSVVLRATRPDQEEQAQRQNRSA